MKTPIFQITRLFLLTCLLSTAAFAFPHQTETDPPSQFQPKTKVVIPAGTPVLIRTDNTLSTDMGLAGTHFPATLAADVVVDGVVVIPRGTYVQGRVMESVSAGRLGGRARMRIELTDISYNNQFIPIITDVRGSAGEENDTAAKAGTGAAIGGILGGWSGVAKGAAIGIGISAATRGKQIEIPSGTLMEFRIQQPVGMEILN